MKTALITGASGGIGLALVKKFIGEGYFVVCHYNSQKGEEKLRREIKNYGLTENAFLLRADFSKPQEVLSFANKVLKDFGHVDLLINNAGVDLYKTVTDTDEKEFSDVMNVNFNSSFLLTKALLPEMIKRQSGNVINISSVWGIVGASMESVYSASKSAMIGFTKALAKEVAPSNIRVNCICPGVIDTPMNDCFSEIEKKDIIDKIPLGRFGKPEEIACLTAFICSEKASYITGQIITIDGGYVL